MFFFGERIMAFPGGTSDEQCVFFFCVWSLAFSGQREQAAELIDRWLQSSSYNILRMGQLKTC